MKNKLMTHVVAGYPSYKNCIELIQGMEKLGVGIIEVQIPFSDPIADGETIMQANDAALESRMTTKKSFDLMKEADCNDSDVYIMSYLQKVLAYGNKLFCKEAKAVNAKGLIIPDLPFDVPEYTELSTQAKKFSLDIVPVISPGMEQNRLKRAVGNAGGLVYLTSMKSITGKKIRMDQTLIKTAEEVKKLSPDVELAIGFGIATKSDVGAVLEIADIAVVGSSVIRKIDKNGVRGALNFISTL